MEVLGNRHKAEIYLRSPFDPESKRLQGFYEDLLPAKSFA